MRRKAVCGGCLALVVALTTCGVLVRRMRDPDRILARLDGATGLAPLTLAYPFDGALFPVGLPAPLVRWKAPVDRQLIWLTYARLPDGRVPVRVVSGRETARFPRDGWETVEREAGTRPVTVAVVGISRWTGRPLTAGQIQIAFTTNVVPGCLFYREVPLPFGEVVKDPSRIRWRYGSPGSREIPPVVLEKLPVCGNCHSFSSDGAVLGLDVDYANDKGSYAIVPVGTNMVLDRDHIITWSDYRREDGQFTFGLLSQVSPDGRYAISTVKDRSVFVARDELAFSQLFFPIRGILGFHDRETKQFAALPGADDPAFVQSNPSWSPDGQTILFAHAPAYRLRQIGDEGAVLLTPAECAEFLEDDKPFRFDLYRIPFNGGRGGVAEPVPGASRNGKSNYFGRYSPDGRWIVFCQASNYMLLQPDSELMIIPAEGGTPRRLECNLGRMNSWHAWSPDSRWLVFTSKVFSDYTQLFLAWIDETGHSRPPVLLEQLVSPDYAANIPEFVNLSTGAIARIREQFLNAVSWTRAAAENLRAQDYIQTEADCQRALAIDPACVEAWSLLGEARSARGDQAGAVAAYQSGLAVLPDDAGALAGLAAVLLKQGRETEAEPLCRRAIAIDSGCAAGWSNLGMILMRKGDLPAARQHVEQAVQRLPGVAALWVNVAEVARAQEDGEGVIRSLREAVRQDPVNVQIRNNLGAALYESGDLEGALEHLREAIRLDPAHLQALENLGLTLLQSGLYAEARPVLERAHEANPADTAVGCDLCRALRNLGQYGPAMTHLNEILQADPDHIEALLETAWICASAGDVKYRDGIRGVELATRACRQVNYEEPACLDVLAACQAERGNFPEAIRTAGEAVRQARARGLDALAGEVEQRLMVYRQNRPWHGPFR
ncbi:MAG: hypothetical protein A2498_15100 [Lentisphaerae bacterium RIFOXYC12_FULL_60_16]|nr:MAG: hypothetical protein A2498_15100 [Lentisphaerae bacterium RIFOXYC12_FULL_60_16]